MSRFNIVRGAGVGVLLLLGALAGPSTAQAQFAFGQTRFGFNANNPYIAAQQYYMNLRASRAAIGSGVMAPAWYPPVYATPFGGSPFGGGGPAGFMANPYMGFGGGYGANLYSPVGAYGVGSNPYSAGGSYASSMSNPYSGGGGYGGGGYGSYFGLPPSAGPGFTLNGGANVLRATSQVWKDQEQARIMRQKYYQDKLETKRKKFDLDMYIAANTPTPSQIHAKIGRQVLKRIQTNSSPQEIRDGRSLNYLLNDIAGKFHDNKTPLSEIALDPGVLQHLNVSKGASNASLGLLRNGDKLAWPTALVEMVPAEKRTDIGAQAQALAQNAIAGKEPDPNAIRDLRAQIAEMDKQLLKKANAFDTPEYTAAQRFLVDLLAATRAIGSGSAAAQVEFQKLVSKGDIHNLNDLVRIMVARGWRFSPALSSDEAAYRALHSALASYDVALNQQVASSEQ